MQLFNLRSCMSFPVPLSLPTHSYQCNEIQNAYLWIYPPKANVTVHGVENLSCYRFNSGIAGHSFCSTCGVAVLNQFHDPEGKLEKVGRVAGTLPVNLRTLNGVDLSVLKIKKVDGKSDRVGNV